MPAKIRSKDQASNDHGIKGSSKDHGIKGSEGKDHGIKGSGRDHGIKGSGKDQLEAAIDPPGGDCLRRSLART
jgi:hypothetical protein